MCSQPRVIFMAWQVGDTDFMITYQLVSFDLDGTLVDTAGEIAEAANLALEAHGVRRRSVNEITLLIGAGTRELMRRLLAICVADVPQLHQTVQFDALMASFDHYYASIFGSAARPYPGCHDALAQLRAAGVLLACVTNKEIRHTHAVLVAAQLDGCFDLTVGGDSLAHKKPHASVLQHVLTVLGVDAGRAAHVGDSAIDVQAARNAGLTAWAVPYGYNAGQPIADANPDRIFANLQQVADHVLTQRLVQKPNAMSSI